MILKALGMVFYSYDIDMLPNNMELWNDHVAKVEDFKGVVKRRQL
jgi:hypothetical protein